MEFVCNKVIIDTKGRYIFVYCTLQGQPFLLLNIYMPNTETEQVEFLKCIASKILELNDHEPIFTILGGDYNCALSPLDAYGGNYRPKYRTIELIEELVENNNLIDIWRLRHPNITGFTWRTNTPLIQRRLDLFLTSNELQPYVINTDILPSVFPDHSIITFALNTFPGEKHGPTYWRFNISLLEDPEYIEAIRKNYVLWKQETVNYLNSTDLWEYLKYKIRDFTIVYSKKKSRAFRTELHDLEKR